MANHFTDNPALQFELQHPLLERIASLKEQDFSLAGAEPEAPFSLADAKDSYARVLATMGAITATTMKANAEGVDIEGPSLNEGRVHYAQGTKKNLLRLQQAGLYGMILPRQYGGLNIPLTVYTMCAEMIGSADPSFCNIWSLQDCAQAIYEFGTEEQKATLLSRVAKGETLSMDLTEPDAGSDLQAAMLRATYDADNDCWRLNGVKRFITNGDANIHLVLARSEEGTTDARGLSLFIYDANDGGVDVRRIEHKLGVHGSPTCELVYNNARATLCGDRKMGLIKYVMSLMNCARLGIAAQSVGLQQAALEEAKNYAAERKQFGKTIAELAPVYQMLGNMQARLDASRTLLYETARYVDLYKALEATSRWRKLEPEERKELKTAARLADCLTPLAKLMNAEFAIQSCYDGLQVHGGSGFMMEYPIQRLMRDARVTNIYEGTSQMQVVAALRYVTNGTYTALHSEWSNKAVAPELLPLQAKATAMGTAYETALAHVKATEDVEYLDFCARALVEMAALTLMAHLLLYNATQNYSLFEHSVQAFILLAESETMRHHTAILSSSPSTLNAYRPSKI